MKPRKKKIKQPDCREDHLDIFLRSLNPYQLLGDVAHERAELHMKAGPTTSNVQSYKRNICLDLKV